MLLTSKQMVKGLITCWVAGTFQTIGIIEFERAIDLGISTGIAPDMRG